MRETSAHQLRDASEPPRHEEGPPRRGHGEREQGQRREDTDRCRGERKSPLGGQRSRRHDSSLPGRSSDCQRAQGPPSPKRKPPPDGSVSCKVPFKKAGETDISIPMEPRRSRLLQTHARRRALAVFPRTEQGPAGSQGLQGGGAVRCGCGQTGRVPVQRESRRSGV